MSAAISASTHEAITVLLLGDGPVVEPLEQALSDAGHDVEVGEAGHASAMFTAVAPELVVLCGRATEHGGAPVLAALSEGARDTEPKVVVLGAASSSARARALAPNLPPTELARRLVEIARAPVPAAPKPAASAVVAKKRADAFTATLPAIGAPSVEVAAPKPAAVVAPKPAAVAVPKPAAVAAPRPAAVAAPKPAAVAVPKPAAVAAPKPAAVAAPRPVTVSKPQREPTLVGMPVATTAPTAEARPVTPTLMLEPAAALEPPVTATQAPAPTAPDDFDDLEIGVEVELPSPQVTEPVAAAPKVADAGPVVPVPGLAARAPRHIPKLATAAVLAAAALGLLLLPGLGSHAEGARKLAQVEVRGAIARRPVAAAAPPAARMAAPTLAPSAAAPATAPAPSEAALSAAAATAPVAHAAAPEPSARGMRLRDDGDRAPSLAEAGMRADAARPPSSAAALAQAKASVRKAEGYMRDGRLGMAEAAYLKSLALFPRYPLAIAGLTRIHLQRHDAGEALRWAKMLVASQPNRGNNQRMLGDAYALAGKQAEATRAWQQAVRYGDRGARQRLAE